jgi:hypothetical protein
VGHFETCAPPQRQPLFNHLVGAAKECDRHREAERLGGLEVDDQLDLCDLLDRKVGGLFAAQKAPT